MRYEEMFKIIRGLEFDKKTPVCTDDGTEICILRPSVVPARLRNKYDVKKNFQVWLKEGNREFRPNHLRIMIDLNLRIRSRPDMKKKLLTIFDNIFYGKDPNKEIEIVKEEKFEHFLNSLKIIANLAQLLLIEQEYNYTKPSKFDPKNLFLQGWIREFIDSPKEIDNMCMSVCRFQPPKVKYTCQENKKHYKYNPDREILWYMD